MGREYIIRTLVVLLVPSSEKVSPKGEAGYLSVSTEAIARTFSPEEPLLPKKGPAAPLLPALIVTTTPSSTRRDAISAQAPVPQPLGPPKDS